MYYAYLDEDNFCYTIGSLSEELEENSRIIKINNYDPNLINRKYDIHQKKWLDIFKELNTETQISSQVQTNAQILNELNYLTCLQEINSMKGGN
ncbi:hypothetical protein [[Clostridium] colinum]|uniref:hypothetical protein n=1 Tax=[Clostridium] colinum TaxID=36835 RepID=UPI0020258F8F|nr:hypothetical protein [[Clostridium] colinum]